MASHVHASQPGRGTVSTADQGARGGGVLTAPEMTPLDPGERAEDLEEGSALLALFSAGDEGGEEARGHGGEGLAGLLDQRQRAARTFIRWAHRA